MSGIDTADVVVITGATSGIGRATARKFGEDGAHVGLLARGEDGLNATAEEIEGSGGEALTIETDVSEYEQVEEAAEQVEAAFGPIDVWINTAMTTVYSLFLDLDPRRIQMCDRCDLPRLRSRITGRPRSDGPPRRGQTRAGRLGDGLLWHPASIGIQWLEASHSRTYRVVASRTAPRRQRCRDNDGSIVRAEHPTVRALSVAPRRAQPVPPIYQPEVAADAIHWAASHDRRELFVGRPTLKTIWGNKFAPWLVDRYLARTAYGGQKAALEYDPDRPDNLYEPVSGDPGAHGPFDTDAVRSSQQLWLSKHRHDLGITLVLFGALLAWLLRDREDS